MLVNTVIKDRIAYVKMQDPKHFNCLSENMCHDLMDAIEDSYKKECVGIVLQAEVNRHVWSAGHDVKELPLDGSDPLAFRVLNYKGKLRIWIWIRIRRSAGSLCEIGGMRLQTRIIRTAKKTGGWGMICDSSTPGLVLICQPSLLFSLPQQYPPPYPPPQP